MGRQEPLAIGLMLSLCCASGQAVADCALIDRLDNLQIIQARLARHPDTALFATDIRQLRGLIAGISDEAVLNAVSGNRFTGHGADFIRFLDETKALLQKISLDDPLSVQAHFNINVRADLDEIRTHLHPLRCHKDDVAIARTAAVADKGAGGEGSDAEDLARVADRLAIVADEVFQLRTLAIVVAAGTAISVVVPILRNWLHLRKRRAKRHNTRHMTRYQWDGRNIDGMLVDINCFGAKLKHETDDPIPVGSTVDVRIDDEDVNCTVVWSNAHYSGVQFRKSITLEAVAFVRGSVDRARTQNGAPRDAA